MRRLLELFMKHDRITKMGELGRKKFDVAASINDKEGMETARNELHASLDAHLDTLYEVSVIQRETEVKILKDFE